MARYSHSDIFGSTEFDINDPPMWTIREAVPNTNAEHERLRSAVVEAAKAHRKAELNYWAKLPHERPASLFTKMENARIRLIGAVDALNAFEASRSIGQKDGER